MKSLLEQAGAGPVSLPARSGVTSNLGAAELSRFRGHRAARLAGAAVDRVSSTVRETGQGRLDREPHHLLTRSP